MRQKCRILLVILLIINHLFSPELKTISENKSKQVKHKCIPGQISPMSDFSDLPAVLQQATQNSKMLFVTDTVWPYL